MFSRDYILRMVEQLSTVLAKALFHKEAKQYELVEEEIDSASLRLIGAPWMFLRAFPEEQLMELLGGDKQPDRLLAASELLRLESELLLDQGEETLCIDQCSKAIGIFNRILELLPNSRSMLHAGEYKTLLERLNVFALPSAFVEKRFVFHELSGSYAKAEDDLFELIDLDAAYCTNGREFYDRILLLSDDELEFGGLPRPEALDGMAELLQRLR